MSPANEYLDKNNTFARLADTRNRIVITAKAERIAIPIGLSFIRVLTWISDDINSIYIVLRLVHSSKYYSELL